MSTHIVCSEVWN